MQCGGSCHARRKAACSALWGLYCAGVVRTLYNRGRLQRCYFTETRPYNQGARLTASELLYDRIPSTLICDDMVAAAMSCHGIDAVITGADRCIVTLYVGVSGTVCVSVCTV